MEGSPNQENSESNNMTEETMRHSVGTLFRINDQFHESALLHFGVAERIFDELVCPRGAYDIAKQRGWVAEKCEVMLNALTSIGLLEKDTDLYRNTALANRHLVSSADYFLGPIIDHQRLQWKLWSEIEIVLSAKTSIEQQQELRLSKDEKANKAFNDAMISLSRDNVSEVASLGVFKHSKRVADLCGGHGSYLVEIARRYPQITGEVWDLPTTRRTANEVFKKAGVQERLVFKEVDLRTVDWTRADYFDVVMLNDCLHYFSEREVRTIVARCAGLLRSEGALIVLSMTLSEDGCEPAGAAGFSFHMMLNTACGRLHPTKTLVDAATTVGLAASVHPIGQLGRYSMIVATNRSASPVYLDVI